MRLLNLVLACLFIPFLGIGQDLHFSQHYASPLHLNPAMTGVFDFDFKDKDLRLSSIYRQQWRTIRGPYVNKATPFNTTIFSADGLLKRQKGLKGSYFGIGALFYRDIAGDLNYESQYSSLSFSYGKKLNRESTTYLNIGLTTAFGRNSVDFSKGVFDNQWNGLAFDPNLPTGEVFPANNTTYTDLSTGIAISTFPQNKAKHTFGVGLFHLNTPNQNFYDENESLLPRKLVVHYQGQLPISYNRDIVPIGFYQTQANAYELNMGVMMKFNFTNAEYKDFKNIQFGGSYRVVGNRATLTKSDAFIMLIRTQYHNFLLGASYDLNLSGLTPATRTIGAFEVSLVYYLDLYKKNREPGRKAKDYRPTCPD